MGVAGAQQAVRCELCVGEGRAIAFSLCAHSAARHPSTAEGHRTGRRTARRTHPKCVARDEPRARLERELAEPAAVAQPNEFALVRRPDLLLDAAGVEQHALAAWNRVSGM